MNHIRITALLMFLLPIQIFSQQALVYRSTTQPKKLKLPDGTDVTMNVKSTLRLPADFNIKNRTVQLSGDAFFHVRPDKKPFIIKTAYLVLTTSAASLRVDAYPSPGEEADVLTGKVKARKSYKSALDDSEYELTAGQMVMINRDIDLIEKENYDSTALKRWLQQLK